MHLRPLSTPARNPSCVDAGKDEKKRRRQTRRRTEPARSESRVQRELYSDKKQDGLMQSIFLVFCGNMASMDLAHFKVLCGRAGFLYGAFHTDTYHEDLEAAFSKAATSGRISLDGLYQVLHDLSIRWHVPEKELIQDLASVYQSSYHGAHMT